MKVGEVVAEVLSCNEIIEKIRKDENLNIVDVQKISSLLFNYKSRLEKLDVQEG